MLAALLGGILIGLSASILLVGVGRIAGISGIVGNLLVPPAESDGGRSGRVAFVVGLGLGGLILLALRPASFGASATPWPLVLAAGLLVGVGTTLGSGCTSGHGICGIGRGSARSIVATCVFMGFGVIATFVVRHVASTETPSPDTSGVRGRSPAGPSRQAREER